VRSKADGMASLIQRTAQKRKIREKSNQKPSSSEETLQEKSEDAVREEEVKLGG